MNLQEKAMRTFNRVLISAESTGKLDAIDPSIMSDLLNSIERVNLDQSEILIVSYVDSSNWLLVSLDSVYWKMDDVLDNINLDSVLSAELNLLTNKIIGFCPSIGFNILTIKKKNGESLNLRMEGGSALEATIAMINELVENR